VRRVSSPGKYEETRGAWGDCSLYTATFLGAERCFFADSRAWGSGLEEGRELMVPHHDSCSESAHARTGVRGGVGVSLLEVLLPGRGDKGSESRTKLV
jgi:hypothetical protein